MDDYDKRLIGVIADVIWAHNSTKTGTVAGGLDVGPDSLAAAIVKRFTCTECGFVDMFEGNYHGECNDCAPRVAARNRNS